MLLFLPENAENYRLEKRVVSFWATLAVGSELPELKDRWDG
jgi:hypothetical protein